LLRGAQLLTYEDVTAYFLKAAGDLALTTHPEYWLNSRSLDREFACTCHAGSCDEAELRSSCTVSFSWGVLDTALSFDGPVGVCEFFHSPDAACPHLRTNAIPPLVFDLSYSLSLHGSAISEAMLLSLTQMLRLHASERSSRTTETRPGVSMTLQDNRLQPDMLTLQQRVELPIWHPEGMHGLHDEAYIRTQSDTYSVPDENEENNEVIIDDPHPEDWLPQVMNDVCQDIIHVLDALDAAVSFHQ
jgi:hypothetical protein